MVTLDEEGVELPDFGSAWERATQEARTMICDSIQKGSLNLDHRIEVADECGDVVLKLTFRDAFTITG